ncbi:MAG: hypothetical protein LBQ50_09845 [Planctomycetaceae bacterium]|nr:hypothetical protein [Planctomycetaceae bacterium]
MSQDNENKPDDFDFNPNFEEKNEETESLFLDNPNDDSFDATFSDDSGFSFPDEAVLPENGTQTVLLDEEDSSGDSGFGELPPVTPPDDSPLSNATFGDPAVSEENAAENDFNISENIVTPKGKDKKDKQPEKTEKIKSNRKPIGLGSALSLTFGGLLLFALVVVNIVQFVSPPSDVSFSSIIYYLIGVDLIGGIGIVAVPFLFHVYKKEIDLFQIMLGISVMALSFAVLLLMTEYFRYGFTRKPASDLPKVAPIRQMADIAPVE